MTPRDETIVYLIDDEPDMLAILRDAASMISFNVESFVRASDFFNQVTNIGSNSILVVDLHMPGMDGIEVIRRLSTMDITPMLILISGKDPGILHSAEKLAKDHNLEVCASLQKPVHIKQFQQLLKRHAHGLDHKHPIREQAPDYHFTVTDLEDAIDNDRLVLHYQPQFDIGSNQISGVEALVRWQHPEYGLIYPDHFCKFAEQNGLMWKLTQWVISTAIKQGKLWQSRGLPITMSVNITADYIRDLTLPDQLLELMAGNQSNPAQLTIEITESMLMEELADSLDILTRFRLKGIGLSIDDFGTGYSSLLLLHRIPFNELKIDRSFIGNITIDTEACAIVKTCILLAHELDMKVVAEGVETKEQLEKLKGLGCDKIQGDFLYHPADGDHVTRILESSFSG